MNLLSKRIPTMLGLLLFVVLIVGSIYYFRTRNVTTTPEIFPAKVKITNVSDNKFTVSWTTKQATAGEIEYGVVGEALTNRVKDERDSAIPGQYITHHVTIQGLQPGTQYAFRILSGEKATRFDNNGSPYTTSTGPVIGATPISKNLYGNVQLASKQAANGAIVYITLPGGATASTIVRESGNYAFTLSTMRTADFRKYVSYDPAATIASLTIESGDQQSTSAVSLANSTPVPTITLGQNMDFLNEQKTNDQQDITITPEKFNVEPLIAQADINAISTAAVTILNPKEIGETLTTFRPEFRGTGPIDLMLSIAITGQKAVSDTVQIGKDGTWSWAPVVDLRAGKQKITVSYLLTGGTTQQKVERDFVISSNPTGLDPAFVSSPSASSTTPSPSLKPTTTATPRAAMPATGSGIPVTGVIENTLLMIGLGTVTMIVGMALLAL